jgi:hypothetical protein
MRHIKRTNSAVIVVAVKTASPLAALTLDSLLTPRAERERHAAATKESSAPVGGDDVSGFITTLKDFPIELILCCGNFL